MSGVQTGSRLERLLALRSQIDMEIAAERRKEVLRIGLEEGRKTRAYVSLRTAEKTRERLAQLGVTAVEVKRWAVLAGHIPAVVRGRISGELIEKYADAHQRKS